MLLDSLTNLNFNLTLFTIENCMADFNAKQVNNLPNRNIILYGNVGKNKASVIKVLVAIIVCNIPKAESLYNQDKTYGIR